MLNLLDTGATCNVIDKMFLENLRDQRIQLNITPLQCAVRCANDSNMDAVGEVILPIEIAGSESWEKFIVINSMRNYNVIVGVRTMKKIGIEVCLKKDCVVVNGSQIKLEGQIDAATMVQGNEFVLNH
jgi:hypothetical protein